MESKKLPERIDGFFISAITALLEGFEPISISADKLIDGLDALGPCDVKTFKHKLDSILETYTNGKDIEKLRIIVKR